MSGGITVKEFKHIPGVNDAEYIKILEELNEINQRIISKAIAKIKKLSAQSEHRTGHWIVHENADIIDGYYVPKYECSCCYTWKDDDSNFCPDCGVDMRERKDKNNEYNTNDN